MTLREQTFDFDEEVQRLEAECREIAEEAAGLDDDNPQKAKRIAEGQRLDTLLSGVRWARDEAYDDGDVPQWDDDVDSVTLAGLNAREFGTIEDELAGDGDAGNGATRILLVADATVEAPYFDEGMSNAEAVGTVGQLPVAYLKWAEDRANSLMQVGGAEGNETNFADLLAEAQTNQNSTGE